MNKIKIFLASSIVEFENERKDLGIFIRSQISDEFEEKYNTKIVPIRCENIDPCMSIDGKQEEYNELIKECEMCFFIFFTRAGQFTQEEFKIAYTQFINSENHKPKVYVYFKNVPDDITVEQSVKDFMKEIDKTYHHYYGTFDHIDTIKLRILLNLKIQEMDFIKIEIKNDKCLVDGNEVLSLVNVSEFMNSKELQKLKLDLAEIEDRYFKLKPLYVKGEIDDNFRKKYVDLAAKRQNLLKIIEELQKNIFELSLNLSKDEVYGNITPRMKEAYRLFELGDSKSCLAILSLDDIDSEFERREKERERESKIDASLYIREHKLAIDILRTMYTYENRFNEIEIRYEKIIKVAEKYDVNLDVLYDYAKWLNEYHHSEKAITIAELLKNLYEKTDESVKIKVELFCFIGSLYQNSGKYKEAYDYYKQTSELWQQIVQSGLVNDELEKLADFYDQLSIFIANLPEEYSDLSDPMNGFFNDMHAGSLSWMARRLKKNLEEHNDIDFKFLKDTTGHEFASQTTYDFLQEGFDDEQRSMLVNFDSETDFVYTNLFMESEELAMFAFCIRSKLLSGDKANFLKYAKAITVTMGNIANIWGRLGRKGGYIEGITESAIRYLKLLQIRNQKLDLRSDFAFHYHTLGVVAFENKEFLKAKSYFTEMINNYKGCANDDPFKYDLTLANALFSIADMYFYQDYKQPISWFNECKSILDNINIIGAINKKLYLSMLINCDLKLSDLYRVIVENQNYEIANNYLTQAISLFNEVNDVDGIDEREFIYIALKINLTMLFMLAPKTSEAINYVIEIMKKAIESCKELSCPDFSYSYGYWQEALNAFKNLNFGIPKLNASNPEIICEWNNAYYVVLDNAFDYLVNIATENPLCLIPTQFRNVSDFSFISSPNEPFLKNYKTLLKVICDDILNINFETDNSNALAVKEKFKELYNVIIQKAKADKLSQYLVIILEQEIKQIK